MPPLDFPNSPSLNQLFAGPNNVQWQWDGSKWLGTPNTLGPVIVAASPPTFQAGQLWWDSTGGNLYLGYDDGNTQQWVPASNITGLANAATLTDVGSALNNVGRNLVHNSMFNIAQRGVGPWTTAVYTADRWLVGTVLDAIGFSLVAVGDGGRGQIGDEAAVSYLGNTFTGNAGAGSQNYVEQRIEGVRRLSGKTVVLSFWITSSSAALKFGVNAYQSFGSGGSPSAGAWALATGIALPTTTAWARVSTTITLPSASGKTLGTNGDDCTMLRLFYSAGSTANPFAGNIGVQTGTINIWGVQLEIVQPGQTVPTKLEKRDPVLELQQCQRFFYQVPHFRTDGYAGAAGIGTYSIIYFPVTMRAIPILTPAFSLTTNMTGPALSSPTQASLGYGATATAVGGFQLGGSATASADL